MVDQKPPELPDYLVVLLQPTPTGIAKLIAAWDGLSTESQIRILTELKNAHAPSYLAEKVHTKALDSDNTYVMRIRSVAGIFFDRYPCVRSNRVVRGIHNYITHHKDDGIHRSVPGRDCTGR